MILRNRLFEREPPSRDAKSIYIFCEGKKREYQYFNFFKELDSRINIEVYELDAHDDNSPRGLLEIATQCLIPSKNNPNPKYFFLEGDEVWLVLDTDPDKYSSRPPQIKWVKETCEKKSGWDVAESNPCFEVWLYYHFEGNKPTFAGLEMCASWKQFLNDAVKGGFDSRKHPIYIETAIKHAKANFKLDDFSPEVSSTEIFKLAESIYRLTKRKIESGLKKINP